MLLKLLLALAAAYLIVCAWAFLSQRRMLYFPDASRPALPPELAARGVREVRFSTEDGLELAAWHWPAREGRPCSDLTLVVFHGNGGHRGWRADWYELLNATGAGVLALDYRGYGGNPGSPSEAGLYRDADAAVAWAREHVGGRLVFLGESLGGGVAVEMAARHAPAGLILENAAATLVDIAKQAYPWLPVSLLMRDRFAAERRMRKIACPLLAIHGEADRVIPLALGRRLYDAAPGPKTWVPVPGAGHGEHVAVLGAEEYLRWIGGFLASLGTPAALPE